jgi:hypothetical protein
MITNWVVACPKYPAKIIPEQKARVIRRSRKTIGAPEKKNNWKTMTFDADAKPPIMVYNGIESRCFIAVKPISIIKP